MVECTGSSGRPANDGGNDGGMTFDDLLAEQEVSDPIDMHNKSSVTFRQPK